MGMLILILFSILILDYAINRYLLNPRDIGESPHNYINRTHKYVENVIYAITIIVIVISINDFYSLRIFIFVLFAMMFLFRFIMQMIYEKEKKTYIQSLVTIGLIIIGAIIYGLVEMG